MNRGPRGNKTPKAEGDVFEISSIKQTLLQGVS